MIKTEMNDDGSSSVVVTTDEPLRQSDGTEVRDQKGAVVMQSSRWNCGGLHQTEAHIATWTDPTRPASERLSPGDKSAFLDRCNEIRKQYNS